MVLGMDGQVVLLRVGRDAPGHGPAGQHAVALEPQVPMEAGGVVLLDDETGEPLPVGRPFGARRLRRGAEVAHLLVALELLPGGAHRPPVCPPPGTAWDS